MTGKLSNLDKKTKKVTILGNEYLIRFDLRAYKFIENACGKTLLEALDLVERGSITMLCYVLHAGLNAKQPDIKEEEVEAMIEALIDAGQFEDLMRQIGQAFEQSQPVNKGDSDNSGDSKNVPAPQTGDTYDSTIKNASEQKKNSGS